AMPPTLPEPGPDSSSSTPPSSVVLHPAAQLSTEVSAANVSGTVANSVNLSLDGIQIEMEPVRRSGHYIQETDHMDQSLSLGNTFASAAYKLKFTVDNGSGPHAILSGDDLTSFNVHQSEFSELLIFGDVSTKYPS